MSIFKAYDIRGIYPTELNEDTFYKIAKAFASFTNAKKIVVGGDNRLSTPSLKNSFIKGLIDSGVDVTDIGTVSTSMVYFSCYRLGFEGGAMITASHNPKEFNGIKMCDSEGLAIGFENGLDKIKKIMEDFEFRVGNGKLQTLDIFNEYNQFVKELVPESFNGLKIIIDGSNGSAGLIYSKILRSLDANVTELFCDPDGNFPNHKIPDPLIGENLKEIKNEVKKINADVGFALDGDGDRLIIIDEKGDVSNTSHIIALLAEKCLEQNKNSKIIYDILSSQLIEEVIRQNGGEPVVWKVGHSNVPRKCKELNAPFAGEASAHYYFKESSYTDDTLIAAIKILNILTSEKKKLSELTSKYPLYYQVLEKRIPVKQEMKFKFIENLTEDFRKKGYTLFTLDGVKIKFENGWAVFRASNTESKIVISYESPDLEQFKRIETFVNRIISEIPADGNNLKGIIFDMQDVLINDWRDVFDLPEISIKPGTLAEFFDDHNDLRKEYQYGRLTEEEFWGQFIQLTNAVVTVEQLKYGVRKILQPFKEIFDMAKSLKQNYKLAILSNFSKEWAEYIISKYGFNDVFDCMFWSFENGIKKPSSDAYLQVTKKFNINPEECIFIDDKERNVEGAKNIGMKTILYTSPDQLKKSLSDMGIKVGD